MIKTTILPSRIEFDTSILNLKPDLYRSVDNLDELVLCRDNNGTPTAIYKDQCWDFTPYDEIGKFKLRFYAFTEDSDDFVDSLVSEAKWLMFLLIYKINAGYSGLLMPGTLYDFSLVVRRLCTFCNEQRHHNQFVSELSIKDVIGKKQWIAKYITDNNCEGRDLFKLRTLLSHLQSLAQEESGLTFDHSSDEISVSLEHKQTPVIPTRIYFELLNAITSNVNIIAPYGDALRRFIRRFKDPFYGRSESSQTSNRSILGVLHEPSRPYFSDAVKQYKLTKVLTKKYGVTNLEEFITWLFDVYALIDTAIHFYTGMRSKEVLRLPYNCIDKEVITPQLTLEEGVCDDARIIALLSTTTKYSGYRKEARWLAPDQLLKIIKLGQEISSGLLYICGIKNDNPKAKLFISAKVINIKSQRLSVKTAAFTAKNLNTWFGHIKITGSDIAELRASDENRDWEEDGFCIGKKWPLTSHQFRRSLAYYAINSKLVSIPNLRRQFQHLCSSVTRYYAQNNENLVTLFGEYDEKDGSYKIPQTHIIHELQTGIPLSTAQALIEDLLSDNDVIFGNSGGLIESLRESTNNDDVFILEVRDETIKKVKSGEMVYRKTLVGGCLSMNSCEEYMLGDLTTGHCLKCNNATVKMSKVNAQILEIESELYQYSFESGEYQILSSELKTLTEYRDLHEDEKQCIEQDQLMLKEELRWERA
jgi:hypothetical protein